MDFNALTNDQKRVVGEVLGPDAVRTLVPDGQQLARAQGTGTNGIDELYRVNNPDVDYVIVEYKFVGDPKKAGADRLGNTDDGLQGSESWMLRAGRLNKAVGRATAADVELANKSGRVESWVITVRPNGATEIQVLDAMGRPKSTSTSKLLPPPSRPRNGGGS